MRIVFLVVFYIATYVAGIADDGETINIMPGNGIKHILRQKSEAIQDEITEKLINDKITRGINKHRGQSLLINRIDSLSQNRKILNGKLARAKRSPQKRKKCAKNSDIAHHPNVFQNNDVDDDKEEEENLSKTRRLPIWQISEPMVAAIDLNSTTNPMIVKQTEMINRSSFKRPRSGNLKSYRVSNEASSLIATDRHPNSHGLFDTNVPDKNLVFSKFPNSKSNRRSPVFKKLNKVPLFAYPPEISVDIDSSNFKPSRGFEWRDNGYLKDFSNLRNNQEDLPDSHLTDSNERFLLVPVSKDLYVLKNIQDSPSVNGMIIPKHKLLERNKNKGNISAILSFKAHMHHDVKDVGKAYLHHKASNNHYLSDYNTNYLYTDLDSRVIEENKEDIMPLSYPNLLYPGIASQTPDVIDVPEILDQQISLRVPDYKYISFMDIDSDIKVVPYDSTIASTAPFFDMSKYDVSSYLKENTNDQQSNVLSTKLNELNSRLDSRNYENSLEYSEISIESTTMDFQSTFGTLDVNTDKSTIHFIDDISTQYRSAFDASNQDNSFSSQFLLNNIENILNNQDTNVDYIGSEIITLSEYNDKKSTFNDFNYDNKFIDETLFSNYTTIKLDSFLNIEDHTTSVLLPSDTDEWSLKKKQSNVGNPRALLKAIEPLSSELKKLLTAVKLVNQSISNVQNRLCDKKNIDRSARIERESKERKATNIAESIYSKDDFHPFMKNFDNQSLDKKKIKIKGKNIVDRISNDIEFKRKTINNYFLNKFTPLRESSISNNPKILNNRNFLKKRKLSESKFPKLDNVEKHRLPRWRFNRNLKSLTRNYKVQAKPIRQLVESRLKRVIRKTTPVIISSHHLLKSNVSSKNNFINRLTQYSPKNKSTSLSGYNTLSIFSDIIADKDNRMNFLSNNKRDLARYNITTKLSNDTEKKYSPVDPQSYREVTAYLDILRLLNMTKKPFIESLISTTEFFATTASILPIEYSIERSTTIAWKTTIAWGKESPEVTESVLYEYLTGTDYEYYEQKYTGIYGYEDRGNVTSWYDYMEETTTEKMKIIATTIKYSISTFVEIMKDFEITTPTKKKIDYEVVEIISLTGLSVTLSAFTVTMPTTQLYTTELPIFPIDTEVFITEIIEETVAMPIEITETSIIIPTVKLTTESVMLLTPFLEGMTDITLRITIPTVTARTSIEEAPIITEKEIVESTLTTLTTEITQSFLTETSTSLFIISTVPSFTTVETAELTITTPTVPILTPLTVMEKLRTTTSIEKPAPVTERMITGISSTIISTESTAVLGENTTWQAITSKITYVTKIQTRIEDVISFTTQALTLATHIPTSTSEITEETSLVTEKIKMTSIKNITTESMTTLSTTPFAPTAQVTESTTETLITTSEIIITTITSSPTISERTETILSTTEKITTLTPKEESPVTQIEKTITAEEMTTTETPTTIETVTTTEILMISETSMSSTTPTTIEVSSTTSIETLLTTIETTLTKLLTPSEILTITGSLPTENRTITKPPTTIGISTLIPTTTEIQTTIKTLTITKTIESTSTSSVILVSVTTIKTVPTTLLITTKRSTVKTTIPITSLKLMTTTSVANITLRETPNTTISSTFLTTIVPTTASVKTTVPITSLKLTTTTLLSLVTNTTLSETPCTISTAFLTEEVETSTTTFSMTSATISTTKILPTTLSTLKTTSSFLNTSVAINRTFFTTIFTTFKTATIETTTLSMTPITTTSPFETTTLIPSTVETNTTLSEITFSTLSTEMVENTTLTTVSLTEIVSTTSLIGLITEERATTWITTERTTIMKATTLMTYLPLSTTMFFIETTETTLFVIETVTATSSEEISTIEEVTAVSFTTIIEETSSIEEITNVTSITVEISTPTKITLTLTEKSTIPAIEISIANTSLASIAMTVSLLPEATTETTSLTTTAIFLPITKELEQTTLLKTTFTPPPEFTPSILITSETPATTSEVISVLPKTVSEEREFTTTLTNPLITYTLETFTTLSIERTTVSIVAATKEMPEAETEYYVAKEPFYEEEYEEYEEYDTEIPTDKWYYYEEYETTTKKSKTTMASSTIKYTKLFKETSPFFFEGTTSSYETKTLEFTMYSTTSTSIYTSKIPYTEGEFTLISALETSTMTIIENRTTIEVETEFITSITSKEKESTTMALTFGSTEEYTLLPSTAFEIITKPLEYLTIPAKYTEPTSKFLTQIWYAPKFTKPEEISEIELEKTSTSERIFTETEFIEEKLISFFVSSTLTTLSEREAIGVTTASIVFSEMETAIEIAYEVTTLATTMLITKEEIAPYTTMFITPEIETELITMRKTTIGREEEKKQLQQLLDDLEQREREVVEREERLKEKERKWEEKKHEEMQREKEKAKNITIITDTASYETSTVPVDTVSTENLTVASTAKIKVTSFVFDTSSLAEIITTSTETTPLYITEEGIFATYFAEKTKEITTQEIFSTYIAEVTEETAILYTTEESTSVTYVTKEIYITNYTILTSYITASIVDIYNISLVSIETTTPYTTEEIYTTSYGTIYLSEPLFTSPTMMFTSPITLATDEFITLPTATFKISSYEIGATSIPIPTPIKERYITSCITLCNEFPFISPTMTLTGRITTAIGITILPVPVTTPISYTQEIIDVYSELFTSSASEFINTTTALAISTITEREYDEEIESLKEKLREKECELKEREKILLEKEERLEKDKIQFELYMKEIEKEVMHTLTTSSEELIMSSLSTPVPPTEKTTVKTQVTTQIKKIFEKKENQTTTKMATSRHETTKVTDIEEKERTRHVPGKTTTQVEEEIVTKRICLNVLENTTIPFVIKKMCLPYLPKRKREQKSVGHLNRKLFSFSNTRENKELKFQNFPSNFRYRGTRGARETTRKIDNLQLSYHEWLSNETTKPMRHFKGFTRIYERKGKSFLRKISTAINYMQENSIHNFQSKTPLYEQHYYPYESLFQSTATFMLNNKKYEKRNAFFDHNLILARRNNFSNNDKCIEKRNVLSTEENTRSWARENRANISSQKVTSTITKKKNLNEKENESYTVNVLHLSYNKDRETYEVISANPNENELTVTTSESNDDNNVNKFEEGDKTTTPYHELEENDRQQEEDDFFEDILENYMNYEEHTTSIPIRDDKFLDRNDDENKIENKTKLLDQMWPTEKSTTYHLGGTRFWELEVTEPSAVLSIPTDTSKTIHVSVSRTTCLYVVLKNEINIDGKAKRNIHYHKRNVYNKETKKYDISIEKRKIGLKNITKENTQNLHELNRYEQNFGGKRKLNGFSRVSKEDSIIAKTRKLCSVNGNESKHRIIKDIKDKTKKKQSAKSQKSQNINPHSPKSCTDSCIMNKKNLGKTITSITANYYSQVKSNNNKRENNKKITNNDITSDHKNRSICVLREGKNHDYLNCICDIVDVIKNIKSILNRVSFSLDEIKALNCSIYKETQDKIVILIDSDAEETREFSQPHYNTESLKGQKYIKLEELEDDFMNDLDLGNDHDIVSLPGVNLNLPCNQDSDGITWLSTISRPSYMWKRADGIAIFGFVAENGDLELRNINAKDTGNYTCVTTYVGPETEEPIETTYEVHLQVVTLPRYIVHGENRYYTRSCDERDLDILITYLPIKLNDIICEADICNAYILTPSCSRNQITINILLLPSHIVKLMTIDPKYCNVICLKGIQDKLSLILSKNLQIFLGKTIIFRLPHYEQRLVPIDEKSTFARWKRGRTNAFAGRTSNIGLFSSCPAGYGLHGTHCIPCNMDSYSEDGISYCKKCPPGTYQPNHGARVCRTCTDPLTKGCHNMLWSSFSAIMITLASLSVMLSIFLLFLWIICCAKKKFCVKKIASIISKANTFEQEDPIEEQSLIKDVSENQDQQWDNEYKAKKKKKKFYLNKKRRKQNETGKYEKMRIYEDEWGSHRIKNTPIVCPDSYRSHEDYNNYYSKQSYRKGPRLPECDFDT